jgi:hypothetical protein
VPADPYWNDHAFPGASLSYPSLAAHAAGAPQREAALEFFRTGLTRLGAS